MAWMFMKMMLYVCNDTSSVDCLFWTQTKNGEELMSILINGKTHRIGLALSGGGFRAAAFHLGVFHKLESMGLLWKLDLLTCVSGGSIVGAFLAANWGKSDTLDRLENYLRTRSIAVSSVIGGILDPFDSRLDKLASSYDKDLYKGLKLSQIANGPRLYLNATNLATGNMFFLLQAAASRPRWGSISSVW
jgi:NTE family protein